MTQTATLVAPSAPGYRGGSSTAEEANCQRTSASFGIALTRTYMGTVTWGQPEKVAPTAVSDAAPIFILNRPEDDVVAQIVGFRSLEDGWDGENAARPPSTALRDAIRFVRATGTLASQLEPSLHVDGSVLLEIGDGSEASFRFLGDQKVICPSAGGVLDFNGFSVPAEVRSLISG